MRERFKSVADVCDHINSLDEMSAGIEQTGRQMYGDVLLRDIFFVSVTIGGKSDMWRFEEVPNDNSLPEITVRRTADNENYSVATAGDLSQVIEKLGADFKL